MAGTSYKIVDRGHFDAWIIREDSPEGVGIAYTDGDVMRLTSDYRESDKEEVEYWADWWDLPIEKEV